MQRDSGNLYFARTQQGTREAAHPSVALDIPTRRLLEHINTPFLFQELVGQVRLSELAIRLRELIRLGMLTTVEREDVELFMLSSAMDVKAVRAPFAAELFPALPVELADKAKRVAHEFFRRVAGVKSLQCEESIALAQNYEELLTALGHAQRELFVLGGISVSNEFAQTVVEPLLAY
jgi:hypothetical protein